MTGPTASNADGWLSAYLYFAHHATPPAGIYTPSCDRVVHEWVAPLVAELQRDGCASSTFFIRYTDHRGPHLRLRILPSAGASPDEIRTRVERATAPGRGEWALAWIPYEPEYERYGGAAAMPIAEQCFAASSRAALELLAGLPDARRARLGRGLVAMLALVHAFLPEEREATAFAEAYGGSYLTALSANDPSTRAALQTAFDDGYDRQAEALANRIRDVWSLLATEEEREPTVDEWYGAACRVRDALHELVSGPGIELAGQPCRDWRTSVWHILPSYVHMTNNRLGIAIPEECYLARAISRALRPVAA